MGVSLKGKSREPQPVGGKNLQARALEVAELKIANRATRAC